MNTHSVPQPSSSSTILHALRLTVLSGTDEGRSAILEQNPIVIGRSSSADFQLSDSTVSEHHVELSLCPPGVRFRDMQSRNGTRITGVRVDSGVAPSGVVLMIGLTTVRIDLAGEYSPPLQESPRFGKGAIVGTSPAMRAMYGRLELLAPRDIPILLQGESGTGKELIAREIHHASKCHDGPYVVVDCGRLTGALAVSELFGHMKGAFTDAKQACVGMFERANGGTLFLDEVGDLPLDIQPLLLRAIQEGEIRPAGASQYRKVRVRLVAATWQDLRSLVNQGRFRQDLFHRISKGIVSVPALSNRMSDIPLLVRKFLSDWSAEQGGAVDISEQALELLSKRRYSGNVRELRSTVELLSMLANGPEITLETILREYSFQDGPDPDETAVTDFPISPVESTKEKDEPLLPFKDAKENALRDFIAQYLRRLVRISRNISHAARISQLQRHTLRELLREYDLYKKKPS